MKKYGFRALGRGFLYALRGFCYCIKTQRNMRIHLVATFHVLLFSGFYHFSRAEYGVLLLTCALVLSSEAMNTALEKLIDGQYQGYHPVAKVVKDVAAGAVLICAVFAIGIGVILFWDMDAFVRMGEIFSRHPWIMIFPILTLWAGITWVFHVPEKTKKKEL